MSNIAITNAFAATGVLATAAVAGAATHVPAIAGGRQPVALSHAMGTSKLAAGTVFIVDSTTLFSFDGSGNAIGSVKLPGPIGNINGGGVTVAGGDVYVTNGQPTNSVSVFSTSLQPKGSFSADLFVPRGIVRAPNNEIYVANGGSTVNIYNVNGGFLGNGQGFPGHYGPSGMTYDGDSRTLWVANYVGAPSSQYGVAEYTLAGGSAKTFNYATQFIAPHAHEEPYSIGYCSQTGIGSPFGFVVVGFIDDGSRLGGSAIQTYSPHGVAFPFSWSLDTNISQPNAIACDSRGEIYVADNSGLLRFNLLGQNMGLPAGGFPGLTPPIYGAYSSLE